MSFDRGDDHDEDVEHAPPGERRIRCPRCKWEPSARDTWACSCGHGWNTFDTGGLCPACGKQWSETQCPRCAAWSPHRAWYAPDDDA